ncbi:TPA: HD domain-containing protein [Vibrio diabolicus]|uniref:HD domain-containing protein n=1 Tax=Vibrio diabolicus subgroup TaxID=2315253 RepID=UPI00062E8B70|nr:MULTISPECIES: HD domain-containing protein [Vibrio diabolicus subgroup]KLE22951.1 phosphohydrolase [Vibrio diabolicus]MCE9831829.1 HD domain-containing protein [Vibrio diabolicus]MCR9302092.1 HD domain-containing protein [Vibrio diabolicus]MCR9426813.1 HD domain-containing protein [Vibrio diabolicus]MCR9476418.1 HD domain-containing protein [Vibrio antiquarius]
MERLEKQLALVIELDKLKNILRQTRVKSAEGRLENSGEHSWHVTLMAILMEEHANAPVDICRVMKMLLIHDVVEIDAGDTFVYDTAASQEQVEKEIRAAERLFGMLPSDQEQELLALWHEFEAAQTDDAKYAKALDRLIPMLLNYHNNGQSWKEHGVSREQALTINKRIEFGSVTLWDKAKELIEEATEKGWLKS